MVLGILAALAGIFKITYTSIIINAPPFMNKTVLNLFVIIFMFFFVVADSMYNILICTYLFTGTHSSGHPASVV